MASFNGFSGNFKFGSGATAVHVTPVKFTPKVTSGSTAPSRGPNPITSPLKVSGQCRNCGGR